jgi:hypothetical protein
MDIRKVFRKRVRVRGEGLDAASDVNVTVAANIGRPGSVTRVSSRQRATAAATSSTPSSATASEGSEGRNDERKNEGTEEPSPDEDRRR